MLFILVSVVKQPDPQTAMFFGSSQTSYFSCFGKFVAISDQLFEP